MLLRNRKERKSIILTMFFKKLMINIYINFFGRTNTVLRNSYLFFNYLQILFSYMYDSPTVKCILQQKKNKEE